ncbi:hypothetical protein Tco_0999252, partial [Tanacetum coccineum]
MDSDGDGSLDNQGRFRNQNGDVVAARAENNGNGNNANQIRCYNYKGVVHYAKNYTIRPRKRDVAYLQTQLLIAQKKEVGIQLQTKEFDLTVAAADCEEIEEVNANCILMVNLQQALTSGIHANIAPIYDSDGSAEGNKTCDPRIYHPLDPCCVFGGSVGGAGTKIVIAEQDLRCRDAKNESRIMTLKTNHENESDAVVVRDFYKKLYNSLGRVPNRCGSSIGKTRGLLSFSRGI